ncbi:hypothetical protein HZ326_26951 [Fusarium oxysporum f. sp. albedinis]|nr:hypothetical protein HZ326_26951 [Fusarium oxysporum f. sp. albedinis]
MHVVHYYVVRVYQKEQHDDACYGAIGLVYADYFQILRNELTLAVSDHVQRLKRYWSFLSMQSSGIMTLNSQKRLKFQS